MWLEAPYGLLTSTNNFFQSNNYVHNRVNAESGATPIPPINFVMTSYASIFIESAIAYKHCTRHCTRNMQDRAELIGQVYTVYVHRMLRPIYCNYSKNIIIWE